MTTKEIAERLVALNREGKYEEVYAELYAPDVLSIENWSGERTEYHGLDAIKKKGEEWAANLLEMHSATTSDPLVADQSFAVTFSMDATFKEGGRQQFTELAVYTVRDGKIVEEEFQA